MTANNKHLSIPNNGYFFDKNNFKIVNYFSLIQHKILNINIIEIKNSIFRKISFLGVPTRNSVFLIKKFS